MDYEACPLRAKHKLDKATKPKYKENRGTRLHTCIENFFTDENDLPPEIGDKNANYIQNIYDFTREITWGQEEEWGFSRGWESTNYKDAWLKAKLDLFYFNRHTELYIADWKSGKSQGNEVKHIMQGQLYALAAIHKFPELTDINVTFVYIDEEKRTTRNYNKNLILKWKASWHARASKMTTALIFPPKPSKITCRFCAYGPQGSDICDYGIKT